MDYESIHRAFPNYTEEMWKGNVPSRPGPKMTDGGTAEHWSAQRGGMETYKGNILQGSFYLGDQVNLWICGKTMMIRRIMADGWMKVWEINPTFSHGPRTKKMEKEEAERYLLRKFPNCKMWDIMQKRAFELFNS